MIIVVFIDFGMRWSVPIEFITNGVLKTFTTIQCDLCALCF